MTESYWTWFDDKKQHAQVCSDLSASAVEEATLALMDVDASTSSPTLAKATSKSAMSKSKGSRK